MVRVTVEKVGLDVETDQAIVLLKDVEGKMVLPIWIGPAEASAIALALQGLKAPRPLTCDLLKLVLDSLETRMAMAMVHDLRDETFFAQLVLEKGGQTYEIDARPSDAIALALRFDAPIYVAEPVLEQAGVPAPTDHTVH
ncbi:MAG: bifunctional nuclease family protein [Firmicutes bacterium]|nr:bifunctional nuclease family protein [Bacillota bacterium]